MKSECNAELQRQKLSLQKKLNYLTREDPTVHSVSHGSRKIKAGKYQNRSDDTFLSTVRSHRKSRWKAKRDTRRNVKKSSKPKPTRPDEEDLERLNPEVMSKSVILTETDRSVLRLSDKFCMTPRSPLDMCDMTVGTYNWAESLRWTYFWYHWELGKKKDGYEDLSEDDLDDYEKMPWKKRTDRSAPPAEPDVENFITECMNDFLDPKNRRRIKGNFSKEEWASATKLRNLPLTHHTAVRFADKSSKAIVTDLTQDDLLIMSDLDDPGHYTTLDHDPSQMIKAKITNWADKWKDHGVLSDEEYDFVTDIEDTVPGKVKPLIKTHKPKPWPIRLLLSGSNTPVQPLSKYVQFNIRHLPHHLPHQIVDTKDFLQKIAKINETLSPLPCSSRIVICDVTKLYPSVNNSMGVPAV